MTSKKRPMIASTAILLAGTLSSQAVSNGYDNLATGTVAGYSEANANSPVFGDSLILSQTGRITTFGATLYNSAAGGNSGTIMAGTMQVKFYDNSVPYSAGALNLPLLGTVNLNWDLTSSGGLAPSFYLAGTFDLTAANIVLPTQVFVTQKFTQTSGHSTRNGLLFYSDPIVGSSPTTCYIKSSATAEGLYAVSGGQFGYSIQVTNSGSAAPAPQFTSITPNGSTLNFSWSSVATRQYQVQYKTNVTSAFWSNLGGLITAAGPTTSSSDSITPGKQRFYRVALLPGAVPPPPVNPDQLLVQPLTLGAKQVLSLPDNSPSAP
jgi:hypothetical protein